LFEWLYSTFSNKPANDVNTRATEHSVLKRVENYINLEQQKNKNNNNNNSKEGIFFFQISYSNGKM
jgi:hypothetical protein